MITHRYYCRPCSRPVPQPVEQLDIDRQWHKACPTCGAVLERKPIQPDLFPEPQLALEFMTPHHKE